MVNVFLSRDTLQGTKYESSPQTQDVGLLTDFQSGNDTFDNSWYTFFYRINNTWTIYIKDFQQNAPHILTKLFENFSLPTFPPYTEVTGKSPFFTFQTRSNLVNNYKGLSKTRLVNN